MAYMNADTKPKVGFRPYGFTNPRRAAMLSGLGQNRPLDPWELHAGPIGTHGMGQWRPFDQDPGGWHLRGLGGAVTDPNTIAAVSEFLSVGLISQDQADQILAGTLKISDVLDSIEANAPDAWATQQLLDANAALMNAGSAGGNVTSQSVPAPQVPSGSQLLYSAAWTVGLGNLFTSPNNVIASLSAQLSPFHMSVIGQQLVTADGPINYGIRITILDSIGHQYLSDAQSILDNLMRSLVGSNVVPQPLQIVAVPGAPLPPGTVVAPSSTAVAWLENNLPLLLLGGVGLLVLGKFVGGRR